MPGWESFDRQIELEVTQCIEEGVPPEAAREAGDRARELLDGRAPEEEIWAAFASLPRRRDFPFEEPDGIDEIRAERPAGAARRYELPYGKAELLNRLHGAWLGRCCGCALGKPYEAFMGGRNGATGRELIKRYLSAIGPGEYPVHGYAPGDSPASAETGLLWSQEATREQIAFMPSDDDIRYTVLGQIVLQKHGAAFTSVDVARGWFDHLGYTHVCTAETQAYRNMVASCSSFRDLARKRSSAELDRETDWHWVTHHLNPYREWIGADIRCDSYAYAAPGWPEKAAEFAWRDARISHVKNGIYGSMFFAAMIAAAFFLDDPVAIVEAGLAEIPQRSRLHADISGTLDSCRRAGFDPARFEEVYDEIYSRLGSYHPVHTNNNAAITVAAVLLGGADFEKVITLAVMGGWDTDCNGATAGSIAGAMQGARKLPARWTAPLHDTLNSLIIDYHPVAISECARRSLDIATLVLADGSMSKIPLKI